jgi:hypothetical protein
MTRLGHAIPTCNEQLLLIDDNCQQIQRRRRKAMANGNSDVKLSEGKVQIQGDTNVEGNLEVQGLLGAQVRRLKGWEWLGSPPSIHLVATDLVLTNQSLSETTRNVALSHVEGDRLVLNRGKGYVGGVEVDGTVNVKDDLIIGQRISFAQSKTPSVTISPEAIKAHNVKVQVSRLTQTGVGNIGMTSYIDIDLIQEILKLKKDVADLTARLKALES